MARSKVLTLRLSSEEDAQLKRAVQITNARMEMGEITGSSLLRWLLERYIRELEGGEPVRQTRPAPHLALATKKLREGRS